MSPLDALEAFLDTAAAEARKVRGGRYHVMRGAVNWAKWPWDDKPFAWSVLCNTTGLFPSNDGNVGTPAAIAFEVFVRGKEDLPDYGIDDHLLAEMRQDVRDVIRALIVARDAGGDYPLVFALFEGEVMATEALDTRESVQGLVVNFTIRF